MKLSTNFDLIEFVQSETANRLQINNYPRILTQRSLRHLCENLLQPFRNALGRPIRVYSGYRCFELNQAVGGVPNSQHLKGEAADCGSDGNARELLAQVLGPGLVFDQAILYRRLNFLHLSLAYEGVNRKQVIYR